MMQLSAEWLVQSLGLFSTRLRNELELLFCGGSKVENIDLYQGPNSCYQPKMMLAYLEPKVSSK